MNKRMGFVVGLLIGSIAMMSFVFAAEKTATELKAYFEAGKRPTQSNFVDLIDSMYLTNDDNWPAILPASDASNLTNIPIPDPLPAVDGGALTGIVVDEWKDVPTSCTYATATSFVFNGDQTSSFATNIRVRLLIDAAYEYSQVNSFSYSSGTNTTAVNIVDTMSSSGLTDCDVSVFTPFPNGAISMSMVGDASNLTFSPVGSIAASDVQGAIAELESEGPGRTETLTNKELVVSNNTITTAASGNLTSTELNAALAELQTDIDAGGGDASAHAILTTGTHGVSGTFVGTSDSQTLTNKTLTTPVISSISNTGTITLPTSTDTLVGRATSDTLTNKILVAASNTITTAASGNLIATEVNAALAELQTDIDTRATASTLTSHTSATTTHGATGAVVGTTNAQTLTNKSINADSNTITNIENADIKTGAAIDAAKIATGVVSSTEFNYLNGVTSAIQTQLNGKLVDLTGTSVKTLSDVFSSMSPIDGQVLTFDTTNGWQSEAIPGGISDHTLLTSIGTNTHAQIDTHIADGTKHRLINDSGTLTTELFSASKINSELSAKSATSHLHDSITNTNLVDKSATETISGSWTFSTAPSIPHRGALVYLDSNQVIGATESAVAFDQESYDTDAIHDNSTNNSRLTVPSGVTKVQLFGHSEVTGGTGQVHEVNIGKNGTSFYIGKAKNTEGSINATPRGLVVSSPVLTVTSGDYFELFLRSPADASFQTLGSATNYSTWFSMEIIE